MLDMFFSACGQRQTTKLAISVSSVREWPNVELGSSSSCFPISLGSYIERRDAWFALASLCFFWIVAEPPKVLQGLKGVVAIPKDVKRCGPQTIAFVHLMT